MVFFVRSVGTVRRRRHATCCSSGYGEARPVVLGAWFGPLSSFISIYDHIRSGEISLLCQLHLSKCFDVTDHTKLLTKLQLYMKLTSLDFLPTFGTAQRVPASLMLWDSTKFQLRFPTISEFSKAPHLALYFFLHFRQRPELVRRGRSGMPTIPKF